MKDREENLGLNKRGKRQYHKPALVGEHVFTAEGTACAQTCGKTGAGCTTVAGKCASNKTVS